MSYVYDVVKILVVKLFSLNCCSIMFNYFIFLFNDVN